VIPRLLPDAQLPLFEGAVLYMSQADAAAALGITTRMIQYWESQGLLHPEQPQEGRSRRYTPRDLVELAFIKAMLVDQGYTVPALKEKLASLPAPYYYDPQDLFWDLRDRRWKTRSQIAVEHLTQAAPQLEPALAHVLQTLAERGQEPASMARAILALVREALAGKLPARPSRRRKR
jgi:DNA-binding transcriptional MerR regulator